MNERQWGKMRQKRPKGSLGRPFLTGMAQNKKGLTIRVASEVSLEDCAQRTAQALEVSAENC
jgi:lysyl-tRNA synthetase class II